ncbi:type 2 lanthipeptide synthetase LanM family protein [Sphaerisporangium sp. NBC_01403]|uniref:type 2 lanthipeptide synthetase LanM family protein n=1 Tax=Sphaerisporangium sp. NBC_01403 TaxID=2903599 RepID=UPI003243273F
MPGTPTLAPSPVIAPAWWTPGLNLAERAVSPVAPDAAEAPEWATVTERVLAMDPGARTAPDGFGSIVRPFAAHAERELAERLPPSRGTVEVEAVLDAFVQQLSARLVRTASRTLVLELHRARKAGRLGGATPEQRFADFVRLHSTPSGLTGLMSEYPVLARLLARMSGQAVDATAELLERFTADRGAIVDRLLGGRDPGPLTRLAESGDRHRGGRAVAVLHFATGARAVYKPRAVAVHEHFNDVVRWLNSLVPGLGLRTVALVDRSAYGWAEFVHPRPCERPADVERFYHRQGALLALLYALNGTDMHYENVIACADQPVPVDVETLLHPALSTVTDPAAAALSASVMETMLLPLSLVGDRGAADMSGLGGDHSAVFPVDVVEWDAPGTDEMRLVRRPARFTGGANRPRLDGDSPDPADHRDALLSGFRAAYDAIVAHRADLAGPRGLLHRFADDEVRVLTRPTHVYASLLDESTHPDVLRDGVERDRVLDYLAPATAEPVHDLTLGHELTELWNGDVPLFGTRPGSRDLWTGSGEVVKGVLRRSALDATILKIQSMGPSDRCDQEWIIRASLSTRRADAGHESGEPVRTVPSGAVPDRWRLLAAACGLADQIIGRGYRDGTRVNWLGLEPAGGHRWTLMPLGAGLATGYSGTALFLTELAHVTGIQRYATAARRALAPLPDLLAALAARPEHVPAIGCGGFSGFGGIAYALARLADLLDDAVLSDCAETAVRLAALAVETDDDLGVADGSAGCLAAMLSVHELTGSPAARRTATACADRLLAHPATSGLPSGFAAGTAGAGWALLRFAASGGGDRYAEHGRELLTRSASELLTGSASELVTRSASELETGSAASLTSAPSWCRGAPGVALALADSPALLADPAISALVDRVVTGIPRGGLLPDHSLCHGEAGRLDLLAVAAERGRTPAVIALLQQGGALLAALERYGPRCGTADVAGPGLLHGLAGIGFALLRLGAPHQVPSVLLLRAPGRQRGT